MPSQDKFLLSASVNSSNAVTNLFDFVWPTSVALWNLQWQAKGYLAQVPNATVDELHARFVAGSGVRGANLQRLAAETAWVEMQQWFSRLLLSETCALFEGWIESALNELGIPNSVRNKNKSVLDKKLQFPTVLDSTGSIAGGVSHAIKTIQGTNGSQFFQDCFLPVLSLNRKNSRASINELLICYRAFKELRNDFVHHGGVASIKAEACYTAYLGLTKIQLGLKEKPELPAVLNGQPIELSIRGVVGLCDVVLRIIATLDCDFANSVYAEHLLKRRWISAHGGRITVTAAGQKRDSHLVRLIRQCKLPTPEALPKLFGYLNGQALVV